MKKKQPFFYDSKHKRDIYQGTRGGYYYYTSNGTRKQVSSEDMNRIKDEYRMLTHTPESRKEHQPIYYQHYMNGQNEKKKKNKLQNNQ